jgi:acetoin utilization deacetylase AcuC-like enzyme
VTIGTTTAGFDGTQTEMTLLYHDDRFQLHDTGQHPECAERLRVVAAHLRSSGLLKQVTCMPVMPATDADILRIHTADHLETIRQFSANGGGRIEVDTQMSDDSATVAALGCGAAVDAVRHVVEGKDKSAFCLVRPPGHHALPNAPMGFCLLNTAAVAARTAVQRFRLSRVLIVDWDVHHGNGTQDAFYEDENVYYFSAHRFPFYPGTGRKSESGRRSGLGTVFNLPLKFGVSREDYRSAFESVLSKAADACRPELVIVSAGFDAHFADPVGSLGLETEDFQWLTTAIMQVASTHASGRIVSLLEGGYHPQVLAECVETHVKILLDQP